jgi:hypothetical protein
MPERRERIILATHKVEVDLKLKDILPLVGVMV